MRYVEQGEPLYEGFISGKKKTPAEVPGVVKSSISLVFVHPEGNKWFEVSPGYFFYSVLRTRLAAIDNAVRDFGVIQDSGMTLAELLKDYPEGMVRLYDPEIDD